MLKALLFFSRIRQILLHNPGLTWTSEGDSALVGVKLFCLHVGNRWTVEDNDPQQMIQQQMDESATPKQWNALLAAFSNQPEGVVYRHEFGDNNITQYVLVDFGWWYAGFKVLLIET